VIQGKQGTQLMKDRTQSINQTFPPENKINFQVLLLNQNQFQRNKNHNDMTSEDN
jgi:hypothetical protein